VSDVLCGHSLGKDKEGVLWLYAEDAAKIGFDDNYIYEVIKGETDEKRVSLVQTDRDACLEAFKEWERKQDKVQY